MVSADLETQRGPETKVIFMRARRERDTNTAGSNRFRPEDNLQKPPKNRKAAATMASGASSCMRCPELGISTNTSWPVVLSDCP